MILNSSHCSAGEDGSILKHIDHVTVVATDVDAVVENDQGWCLNALGDAPAARRNMALKALTLS